MAAVIAFTIIVIFTAQASGAASSPVWNKTYHIGNETSRQQVTLTDDGYLIAGSVGVWDDFFLIKTDFDGNEAWNRTYTDPRYNSSLFNPLRLTSIMAKRDRYVVSGTKPYWVANVRTAYLAEIDKNGSFIWSHIYNGLMGESNSIIPVNDGYVMAGSNGIEAHLGMCKSSMLVKTDLKGDLIWRRTYDAPGADEWRRAARANMSSPINSVRPDSTFTTVVAADDGYIMAGEANGSSWVVKIDLDGNESWNRTYGWGKIYKIIKASDGYVFFNISSLVKIDENGDPIWNYNLSGYRPSLCIGPPDVVPDGYVLAGTTVSQVTGTTQLFLMKIDGEGNQLWNVSYALTGNNLVNGLIADHRAYVIVGAAIINDTDYWGTPWLLKTSVDNSSATPLTTARPTYSNVSATPKTQPANPSQDQASPTPATPAANQLLTTLAITVAVIAVRSRNK